MNFNSQQTTQFQLYSQKELNQLPHIQHQNKSSKINTPFKTRIPKKLYYQYFQYFKDFQQQAQQYIQTYIHDQQRCLEYKLIVNLHHLTYNILCYQKGINSIIGINQTANIVNYQLIIGIFNIQVKLLNLNEKSPSITIYEEGGYGTIFQIKYNLQKQMIIKRIYFKQFVDNGSKQLNIQANKIQIQDTICQYAFYKICSFLKIGPKIIMDFGFDLICFEDSIQFYMEKCSSCFNSLNFESQVKLVLKILHILKIIHKDIKPENILYSYSYKKFVFSDFGITHPIIQDLGYLTKTYKEGTPSYMSQQMVKIDQSEPNYINLYNNDVYGLQLAIKQIRKCQLKQQNIFYEYNKNMKVNKFYACLYVMDSVLHKSGEYIKQRYNEYLKMGGDLKDVKRRLQIFDNKTLKSIKNRLKDFVELYKLFIDEKNNKINYKNLFENLIRVNMTGGLFLYNLELYGREYYLNFDLLNEKLFDRFNRGRKNDFLSVLYVHNDDKIYECMNKIKDEVINDKWILKNQIIGCLKQKNVNMKKLQGLLIELQSKDDNDLYSIFIQKIRNMVCNLQNRQLIIMKKQRMFVKTFLGTFNELLNNKKYDLVYQMLKQSRKLHGQVVIYVQLQQSKLAYNIRKCSKNNQHLYKIHYWRNAFITPYQTLLLKYLKYSLYNQNQTQLIHHYFSQIKKSIQNHRFLVQNPQVLNKCYQYQMQHYYPINQLKYISIKIQSLQIKNKTKYFNKLQILQDQTQIAIFCFKSQLYRSSYQYFVSTLQYAPFITPIVSGIMSQTIIHILMVIFKIEQDKLLQQFCQSLKQFFNYYQIYIIQQYMNKVLQQNNTNIFILLTFIALIPHFQDEMKGNLSDYYKKMKHLLSNELYMQALIHMSDEFMKLGIGYKFEEINLNVKLSELFYKYGNFNMSNRLMKHMLKYVEKDRYNMQLSLYLMGLNSFKGQNYVQCIYYYEKFISLKGTEDIKILQKLVRCYRSLKKWVRSKQCLWKLIQLKYKNKLLLQWLLKEGYYQQYDIVKNNKRWSRRVIQNYKYNICTHHMKLNKLTMQKQKKKLKYIQIKYHIQ